MDRSSFVLKSSCSFVLLSFLPLLLFPSTICVRNQSPIDRDCTAIGDLLKSKGFSYPWWEPSRGEERKPEAAVGCPVGTGGKSAKCCRNFESTLLRNQVGTAFNEKWLGTKLGINAEMFKDRKSRFDVTFKALLTRAHASFHSMFERTYGMLYIQHAHVFHALFNTLETYYDTGKDSLESKLNEFFAILTRKMFEVLNAQYEFEEAYLSCATIVISEKQGNDLHRQIVASLRRSFVATRALAQGLQDGDKVLTNLQKLQVGPECLLSLSQMIHCPICAEQRAYKPCTSLCLSVTTNCLSSTTTIGKPWLDFTNALEGIIDRLLGPYNVEAVVEPIHIKISEAIMNFQESGPELSQAVFSKCGKPKLKSSRSYSKRDTTSNDSRKRDSRRKSSTGLEDTDSDPEAQSDGAVSTPNQEGDLQPSKSLEKLLRETKNRVKKVKTLWDVLPRQVCNGISKDYSSQLCWNGTAVVKPDKNKSAEESEVRPPQGKGSPNALVAEQVLVLQLITDKLRASHSGLDVQWVQEIEEFDLGSGMGSGSGDIPTDLEDSDDDDPSGQLRPQWKPPSAPKFPSGPPPPIFKPLPGDADNDRDNSANINVNSNSNRRPGQATGDGGGNSGGIDFFVPAPKNKADTSPSTTTTRKPDDVNKTTTTSTGNIDDTGKTIAVFKLFTPIIVSMIGKLFSFS